MEAFLFDCDGVLFRGTNVIAGAPELVERLNALGKKVLFVTNNATKSRQDNVEKLTSMGIPARGPEQVICSSFSAARYLAHQGHKTAFVVGESGLDDELRLAGVSPHRAEEPACDAVVVGLDRRFCYESMAML